MAKATKKKKKTTKKATAGAVGAGDAKIGSAGSAVTADDAWGDPVTSLLEEEKGEKKGSKKDMPSVKINDASITKFLESYKTIKDETARKEDALEEIRLEAEPLRIEVSRKAGEVKESLNLNNRVAFIQPHGYKSIPLSKTTGKGKDKKTDKNPQFLVLRQVFGDKFGLYFKPGNDMKIKSAEIDKDFLIGFKQLCEKHGKTMEQVLEVTQVVVPTHQLTEDRVLKPEIEALFNEAATQGAIVPKKPTVKEK